MRTPTFLLLLLISILWESGAYGRGSTQTWIPATTSAPSCTLDVVLVTFDDATTANPMTPESCGSATDPQRCDYHEHDRPYGTNPGQDVRDRYTLREFERLFIGGYGSLQDSAFVGNTVKVAKGRHTLPEVFGSVRAYYDSMSNGAFQLHVRIINPTDAQDYPRWVELPRTKAHYAEMDLPRGGRHQFWNDAYNTAWDSVQSWNANITDYSIADLPNDTYDTARRLPTPSTYAIWVGSRRPKSEALRTITASP